MKITWNTLWSKSWGPRPSHPEKALRVTRNALKRAPLLIPIFNHCYIPCNLSLARNSIFFMDENRIFCCGLDLSDFFEHESLFQSSESPDPQILKRQRSMSEKSTDSSSNFLRRSRDQGGSVGARTPRWVEFWSDVAVDRRRKNSSSSLSSSPERFFEMPRSEMPKWVEDLWYGFGFDLGIRFVFVIFDLGIYGFWF